MGLWSQGRCTDPPELIGTLEPSSEAIAALAPDLILDVTSSGDPTRHDRLSGISTVGGVASTRYAIEHLVSSITDALR